MIIIDPKTRQRIVVDKYTGDTVYTRQGDSAVSQEDEPLGAAREPNISGTQITREKQLWAGAGNELQGTDPGIMGVQLDPLTERGNRRDTHITQEVQIRVDVDKLRKENEARSRN